MGVLKEIFREWATELARRVGLEPLAAANALGALCRRGLARRQRHGRYVAALRVEREGPDTGESPGSIRDRVLRVFLAEPGAELRAAEVAERAGLANAHAATGPLSTLPSDGKLRRVAFGVYGLAEGGRA